MRQICNITGVNIFNNYFTNGNYYVYIHELKLWVPLQNWIHIHSFAVSILECIPPNVKPYILGSSCCYCYANVIDTAGIELLIVGWLYIVSCVGWYCWLCCYHWILLCNNWSWCDRSHANVDIDTWRHSFPLFRCIFFYIKVTAIFRQSRIRIVKGQHR